MFNTQFMKKLQTLWNQDETIPSTLKSINFNANVGYGYQGKENPETVLIIKEGTASEAKVYEGETLDWDIRCSEDNWVYYMKNGMGMTTLGSAYTMGWMKFLKGDYFSMIKNPSMIGPFIKSFELMSKVYKDQ
ncbi:predicted protein [Naegleria gruberi]|uniref:Predicted protein n=1 Tax=Naegleria gruberi TaxID=5762 RepID=D2UZI0_NAEGR|nr:uncharacterized protein NAEGRDRAFT_61944 [Naegleria gruberi]EFC49949.1 predicted protein [Naegleria gruberi]|eukprot:XP_002682693.1 predicted protein [Naegleria gruberi strain NEG-M]